MVYCKIQRLDNVSVNVKLELHLGLLLFRGSLCIPATEVR
jgi:hypothetical protein